MSPVSPVLLFGMCVERARNGMFSRAMLHHHTSCCKAEAKAGRGVVGVVEPGGCERLTGHVGHVVRGLLQ